MENKQQPMIPLCHGLSINEQKLSMDHMFHTLWTACVGTKEYNKTAWKEIYRQLQEAKIIM